MWRVMDRLGPEVLLKGNTEGIDMVKAEQGGYAFFMESTTIEYLINRHCDLRKVGGQLDSKSYGIAMPQGIALSLVCLSFLLLCRLVPYSRLIFCAF